MDEIRQVARSGLSILDGPVLVGEGKRRVAQAAGHTPLIGMADRQIGHGPRRVGMFVFVNVSAAAAVMAGKTRSGKLRVTLTDEWLAGLTEDERRIVAKFATEEAGAAINEYQSLPPVSEASLDSLLVLVRGTLDAEAQKAAEKAKADALYAENAEKVSAAVIQNPSLAVNQAGEYNQGIIPDWIRADNVCVKYMSLSDTAKAAVKAHQQIVLAEIEKRKQAQRAEEEAKAAARKQEQAEEAKMAELFQEARDALVLQAGTDDQKGRLIDNLLPQNEAEQIVRDYLFAPLSEFAAYMKLTNRDVEHEDDENGYGCEGTVEFTVEDADSLPAAQWRTLKAIQAAASKGAIDGAIITPRRHRAECESCGAFSVKYSAKVEIGWHGRVFCRVFDL